jgi:hypothetical protein
VGKSGWYGPIDSAQAAIYEKLCAMDNQDIPVEQWPDLIVRELAMHGYAIVPVAIPHEILGQAAIDGVFETGNPKYGWDILVAKTRTYPLKAVPNG